MGITWPTGSYILARRNYNISKLEVLIYSMAAADSRQLDSPVTRGSENLYFIGVAGAIAISLLLVVMVVMVTIRRYRQSKKVEAHVDLNQHIYDTPDSCDLQPPLPPRPSKLRRTGQLLCSEQLVDNSPIEGVQNCAKMEENLEEESKETSCDRTQLTDDNYYRKLLLNDSPEDNVLPSIPVQVNGTTTMAVLDHTERMEELCDPSVANSPKLSLLSSGQSSGYEQIQGYEKIQHYEQIQGYEKIQHCDVNLALLVGEGQVETVANPASTLALSNPILGSSEDIQAQCHLADCCHECKGRNLEISLDNITGSNLGRVPVALDSASVQIESPIPTNVSENEAFQVENNTGTCFEGSNANSSCGYERIEHCDLNIADILSPTFAEDVVDTAASSE
jgi:hypothetical protein